MSSFNIGHFVLTCDPRFFRSSQMACLCIRISFKSAEELKTYPSLPLSSPSPVSFGKSCNRNGHTPSPFLVPTANANVPRNRRCCCVTILYRIRTKVRGEDLDATLVDPFRLHDRTFLTSTFSASIFGEILASPDIFAISIVTNIDIHSGLHSCNFQSRCSVQ